MKASYILKSILLLLVVSVMSGCVFYDEESFDEETLVNFNGGFSINGKMTNWLGYVTFASSAEGFTVTSRAAGASSGVVISINTPLGKSGKATDGRIVVTLEGEVIEFTNCTSDLTFDTLTAQVNLRGYVNGRKENGDYASFSFLDSKVTLSE